MFWNLGLKGLLVHSVGKVAPCLMNCHFGIPLVIARGTKPAAPNGALHLHGQRWKDQSTGLPSKTGGDR